jgi:hypothetical protein
MVNGQWRIVKRERSNMKCEHKLQTTAQLYILAALPLFINKITNNKTTNYLLSKIRNVVPLPTSDDFTVNDP